MERTFALKGKEKPCLSIPSEGEEAVPQTFKLSYQRHFETLQLRLFIYTLPFAPGKKFYACSVLWLPWCSPGIPEAKLKDYLRTLLDSTLGPDTWVITE